MSFCRCFMFGIGQNACRRLVQGLATVSKGTAEFLADGERLQPKVIFAQLFLLKTGFFWPPESRYVVIYRHWELINKELMSQRCQRLCIPVREKMWFTPESLFSHINHTDDKVSEENHVSSTQWYFHWMALSWDQGSASVPCGQHLPVSRGQSD